MGVRHRRCPLCRKLRSVTTGKHRIEDRRWGDHPVLGRICFVCLADPETLGETGPGILEG